MITDWRPPMRTSSPNLAVLLATLAIAVAVPRSAAGQG